MNKQVNFEDNIFILMMRIRMIRDTITLDADPELFLEKTMDDINFIDNSLSVILGYLRENNRLIERDEMLEHISELEWQFAQVIQDLTNNTGNFSVRQIPALMLKLGLVRNKSLERRRTARNLSPIGDSQNDDEQIVSSDELTELLKAL